MPRKQNESYKDYKQRVIDPKSNSFCGAKWYNATVWLGSGQTTSCHHPLPHQITTQEVLANPKALHNTAHKKQERAQMQAGERPPGCEYCWKIEDIGRDNISDRVYKTVIYTDEQLDKAFTAPSSEDFDLETLEIAFDRTCNFACSYCNPAFSTTWVNDIKKNGPYVDLVSDGRGHFDHTHDASQLFKYGEFNPYADAFLKWWESDLHRTLKELRVTGGEPTMSADMWKLFDWFKDNHGKSKTRLAINSNLGGKDELIDRLIENSHYIEHFHLYTSNESIGAHAEYIRDGLEWDRWTKNIMRLINEGNVESLNVMCTINSLCLASLTEFLDWMLEAKKVSMAKNGKRDPVFSLNILRFPSFQSPLVLPAEFKEEARIKLQNWLDTNRNSPLLHAFEIDQTQRLIDYLDVVKTPHTDTASQPALENDFKKFYTQYDQRRGKDFRATFPQFAEWYDSLKTKTVIPIKAQ